MSREEQDLRDRKRAMSVTLNSPEYEKDQAIVILTRLMLKAEERIKILKHQANETREYADKLKTKIKE
jgi:hypothetical protein